MIRRSYIMKHLHQLILAGLCFIVLAGASTRVNAQTFQQGYSKYVNGDFSGAERSFQQALPKTRNPKEKAKIFKFLGIVQYAQGRKSNAGGSFKQALALDRSTSVSADEVLDESTVSFFNSQKSSAPARPVAVAKKAPPKAPPQAQRPASPQRMAAPAPKPTNPIGRGGMLTPEKKAKLTQLKVVSNVQNATILIDGILAGTSGTYIDVSPGKLELTLSAPGYITKRIRTSITANRENLVTINLDKPKPKATPTPKPQAAAIAAAGKGGKAGKGKKSGLFLPEANEEPENGSGGGRNLAAEFEYDVASGGYQQPPPQQPMYGGYPPQPPQMGLAQPQPMYGPQPPPQPYGYAAPPSYGYAPPAYAPPQAQPYYGAPAVTAPMSAPPVAPPPPPPEPVAQMAPPPAEAPATSIYRDNSPRTFKKTSSSGSFSVFHLLPFGAGQYYNGATMLGIAFSASEVGSLAYWYMMDQKAQQMAQETNSYVSKAEQTDDYKTNKDGYADRVKDYHAKSKASIDETSQLSSYGLYAFAGLWGVGVVESIINAPDPQTRSLKRRRTTFHLLPEGAVALSHEWDF